jgi:hypothetical protein
VQLFFSCHQWFSHTSISRYSSRVRVGVKRKLGEISKSSRMSVLVVRYEEKYMWADTSCPRARYICGTGRGCDVQLFSSFFAEHLLSWRILLMVRSVICCWRMYNDAQKHKQSVHVHFRWTGVSHKSKRATWYFLDVTLACYIDIFPKRWLRLGL